MCVRNVDIGIFVPNVTDIKSVFTKMYKHDLGDWIVNMSISKLPMIVIMSPKLQKSGFPVFLWFCGNPKWGSQTADVTTDPLIPTCDLCMT